MAIIKKISEISNLNFLGNSKRIFILIGIVCFCWLYNIQKTNEFQLTILLPLFYILSTYLFINKTVLKYGLGSFSLVMLYCVRMCIFPLIIAMGNYYFEPPKSLYIDFYLWSILLMGLENILIFWFINKLVYKYIYITPNESKVANNSNNIIFHVILLFTIITFSTFYIKGIDYYHFIMDESIEQFTVDELKIEKQSGIMWYLSDYLSGLWRILLSSWCIIKGFNRWPNKILTITLFIVIMNMLFLSDRRIFAVVVSFFCILYYLRYFAIKKTRRLIILVTIISIVIMGYYFGVNYAHQGGMEMISRSIQRYFSGPSLSALALRINNDINTVPREFFRLLHNDFQLLQGFFGKLEIHDYVDRYFPSKGIWTPFVAGSLRYFGLLFFIPLLFCVWCIIKWDSMSRKSKDYLHSMLYSYISFSISFYLIMYSIELVFYFIISTGLVLTGIIYLDKRYKFKKYFIINNESINVIRCQQHSYKTLGKVISRKRN